MSRTTAALKAKLAEMVATRIREEAELAALLTMNAEKRAALAKFEAACEAIVAGK